MRINRTNAFCEWEQKHGTLVEYPLPEGTSKQVVSYAEPVVQDELTRVDEFSSWIMVASVAILSPSCPFYFHEYFFISASQHRLRGRSLSVCTTRS